MVGEEQEPEGQSADRRGLEAAVGSEHSGHGRVARRGRSAGQRYSVDDGPRQRLPRAAERRDGRRAAHAQESSRHRSADLERAAEGGNQGHRKQDRRSGGASEYPGRLRPFVQSDGGLRAAHLSVPADLLPALPDRRYRREQHDLVRRRRRHGRSVGRRMGLGLRVGRQRHRHQREQQFRPQQQHQEHQRQRQPGRQLATSGRTIRGTEAARRTRTEATADRFGGTARGDSLASRQSGARTQPSGGGAARSNQRIPALAPGVQDRGTPCQTAAPAVESAAQARAGYRTAAPAVETESAIERFREAPGQEAAAPSAAALGEAVAPGRAAAAALTAPEAHAEAADAGGKR